MRMKNLQPIFSKMEVEGASLGVVDLLEKLEACVPESHQSVSLINQVFHQRN
jgi:hypothetical protein